MTQQPYQSPQPPVPPAPVAKKPSPLTSKPVIGIAALIVGLVLGTVVGGGSGKTPTSVAGAAPTVTVTATETATYEATDGSTDDGTDSSSTGTVSKSDFAIKLKVTAKQCFGSAGCNVTTKATVSYVGSGSVSDLPSSITITYKIKGAEDPYTATIEMEDGEYSPDIANIGTRRSSDKLTAVITDVESS